MELLSSPRSLFFKTKPEFVTQLESYSKSNFFNPLIVKNDGGVSRTNLFTFCLEKIKGRFGWKDRTDRFFIEYKMIQFLALGKRWVKPEEINLLQLVGTVARRVGLTRSNRHNHLELAAVVDDLCKKTLRSQRIPYHLAYNFFIRHQRELKPHVKEIRKNLDVLERNKRAHREYRQKLMSENPSVIFETAQLNMEKPFKIEEHHLDLCPELPLLKRSEQLIGEEVFFDQSIEPSKSEELETFICDHSLRAAYISVEEKVPSVFISDQKSSLEADKVEEDGITREDKSGELSHEDPEELNDVDPFDTSKDFFSDTRSYQQKIWDLFVECALKNDAASQASALEISLILNKDTIKKLVPSLFSSQDLSSKGSVMESRGWKFIQSRLGKNDLASRAIVKEIFDYFLMKNHLFAVLALAKASIEQENELYRRIVKKTFEYFMERKKPVFVLKLARKCIKLGVEIDPLIIGSVFEDLISKKKFDLALKLTLIYVGKEDEVSQAFIENAFNLFIHLNELDHAFAVALAYVGRDEEVNGKVLESAFNDFIRIRAFKHALKLALACLEKDEGFSPLIAIHAYFIFYEQNPESVIELVEACKKKNTDASQYILYLERMKEKEIHHLSICR